MNNLNVVIAGWLNASFGGRVGVCMNMARDSKEIWSMDWCSNHDFVLNKQKTQKW